MKQSLSGVAFDMLIMPSWTDVSARSSQVVRPPSTLRRHGHQQRHLTALLSLLERCATLRHLKQIQTHMTTAGLLADPFAASRLIASSCAVSTTSADLPYAGLILVSLDCPTALCWNLAIRSYSGSREPLRAVALYRSMLRTCARPDNYTFPFLFKACSRTADVGTGFGLFGHALRLGFGSDVFTLNSLMHMLASNRRLEDARVLFDTSSVQDLVSWNTLINAYVQSGRSAEALGIFREMMAAGVRPDEVTMIGVVSCCSQLQDLELGKKFHRYVEENGIVRTVRLTNALMDMYVKCKSLEPAQSLFDSMPERTVVSWTTMVVGYASLGYLDISRKLFDEMPEKDVVPWNALIAGYAQSKRGMDAINLFHEMQASNVKPDEVTMVSLLSACSQLGALEIGMWIHQYIDRNNFCLNVAVGTAIVDMYAKCGNIEKAVTVFKEIPERNALTWTAIICGLASHGHAFDAIDYFLEMSKIELKPDEVTFIGVLSACSHAGLVEEGRHFFSQMTSKYNLCPRVKHYSCMIDLLGRAGLLNEAKDLVNSMPMEPDAVVLSSLFFACRIHGNVMMGEWAALRLIKLDPNDSGTYVLLANMYVESNMRDKAGKVRELMRGMGIEKTPGCSSIEVNGTVHEFLVRDRMHKERRKIDDCLMQLARQMEQKEDLLDISEVDINNEHFSLIKSNSECNKQ